LIFIEYAKKKKNQLLPAIGELDPNGTNAFHFSHATQEHQTNANVHPFLHAIRKHYS